MGNPREGKPRDPMGCFGTLGNAWDPMGGEPCGTQRELFCVFSQLLLCFRVLLEVFDTRSWEQPETTKDNFGGILCVSDFQETFQDIQKSWKCGVLDLPIR